jgi:hypothetical protein
MGGATSHNIIKEVWKRTFVKERKKVKRNIFSYMLPLIVLS